MFALLKKYLARWFGGPSTNGNLTDRTRNLQSEDALAHQEGQVDASPDNHLLPYDETLLERARMQWQFGDWNSLSRIDIETLRRHPDRAKLALLAAAGHLQTNDPATAKQCIQLAGDWGVSKKLIARILVAGVHNSLGRAAALSSNSALAVEHFESSIAVGAPGCDPKLLVKARIGEQLDQLGLQNNISSTKIALEKKQTFAPTSMADAKDLKFETYPCIFSIPMNVEGTDIFGLFNTTEISHFNYSDGTLTYDAPDSHPLYFLTSSSGNFNDPSIAQFKLAPDCKYVVEGFIDYAAQNPPVFWIFQYSGNAKADVKKSFGIVEGKFRANFKVATQIKSVVFGLRTASKGTINTERSWIRIKSYENEILDSNATALPALDLEPLSENIKVLTEMLKQQKAELKAQRVKQNDELLRLRNFLGSNIKTEISKSTKQIEAFVGLQNYFSTGELPNVNVELHTWPISPDFSLYLVELLQLNDYDIIIEFGSGLSTVIIAKTLAKMAALQQGTSSPPEFISFDHLEKFYQQTRSNLQSIGLEDLVRLTFAPLHDWNAPNGKIYPYYDCEPVLAELVQRRPPAGLRLLVIVDGPPEGTGKHARYPAGPLILKYFSGGRIDLLADDYIRPDEKEVVQLWQADIAAAGLTQTTTERQLEKGACLIRIHPAGDNAVS